MRYHVTLLAAVCLQLSHTALLHGADWLSSVDAALEKAKAGEKDVFVIFTVAGMEKRKGAYRDWWQAVIQPGKVPAEVQEKFVVVHLCVPADGEPLADKSAQQWRQNLLRPFSGYPRTYALDARGRPYDTSLGVYASIERWWEMPIPRQAIRRQRDEALAAAGESRGLEKARKLDDALTPIYDAIVHDYYLPEVEEIIRLDAENEAGLRDKYLARKYLHEAEQFHGPNQRERLLAAIDLVIEKYDLDGQMVQELYVRKALACLVVDKAKAEQAFRQALEAAPDGRQVLRINAYLKSLAAE